MVLIYDFPQSTVVIVITFLNKEKKRKKKKVFSIPSSPSLVYLIKHHSIDFFVCIYLFVKNVTFDFYLFIIFVNNVTGFYLFINF